MKAKQFSRVGTLILALLGLAPAARAADITATGSGNWSSTVPDAPWPGGVIPGTNDSIDVEAPFSITVDTNITCGYVYGGGAVSLAPGVTFTIRGDPAGAYGAQQLATLNATAAGCTVEYQGNAFWAKRTDYQNLVFSGYGDFYNGSIPGAGATSMNIAGNLTMTGTNIAVQQGADISIGGNLSILGPTNKWDCSSFQLSVNGDTVVSGTRALLVDLDGALGFNQFHGNMTIGSNALAWNVSDVIHWEVDGSLTNQGLIAGRGYGSITFGGAGIITGKPIKLPTITVIGTYTIGTTITLTTNTPTLYGTLIFDLAKTNQLVLQSDPANPLTLYYAGSLEVINSGAAPAPGTSYKFFSATNYGGNFSATTFPGLPDGLNWVDHLATGGSIAVEGVLAAPPVLALERNGATLTLSWDSVTFPGYSVQVQTNQNGVGTNWTATTSGSTSPFITTLYPASAPVFFRLSKP